MPRVLALRALLLLTATLALPCGSALAAPPPGDPFASPEVLTGTDATATNDTTEATEEAGEPIVGSSSGGASSVWYAWTAPSDGEAGVDTLGSSYDTLIGVYTGDSIAHLDQVAYSNDASGGTRASRVTFRAVEGTTYRILVDGVRYAERGNLAITLRLRGAPANDAFTAATVLPPERAVIVAGDTLGATRETGEPEHQSYVTARRTVWYSFTAPAGGSLTLRSTVQPGVRPILAAYTGATVTELARVPNQAQDYQGGQEQIRLRVAAGETYRIAVESWDNGGEFSLSLELTDSPPNDDFADASPLVGEVVDAVGSTVAATQEPCEPVHDQNYYDPSVWHTWTAPADGGVVIDTTGSDFPTVLGLYTGTDLCALQRVPGVNRLTGVNVPAKRSFAVKGGVTYRIAVDGQRAKMGSYKLSLRWTPPPPNDMIADALQLAGTSLSADGTTLGATHERGEPRGEVEGSSVWYRWTAPSGGETNVTLARPSFATHAYVQAYTRSPTGELKPPPTGGAFAFRAAAGTTYYFVVDGWYPADHGAFTLRLEHHPAPPNDDFASAAPLDGASDTASGTTVGATREHDEPDPPVGYGRGSVWHVWTAPADGSVAIDTAGSSFDTVLGAYTGESLSALTRVASGNDISLTDRTSRVAFRVRAGVTYRIHVNGYSDLRGDYRLRLEYRGPPANDAFAAAAPLPPAASASVVGSNLGATAETGEPAHYSYRTAAASVWYAWTAPNSGSLTIRATPGGFAPVLAAYTGETIAGLVRVPNQAQDWNGGPEQIRLRVEAGRTYYIAVDSLTNVGGDFTLALALIPSPPNDDFVNAAEIAGEALDLAGSTLGATQEPCEPVHDGNYYDPSVWFTWTAPADGAVTLDSAGSEFPTILAAYTGHELCKLLRVPLRRMSTGTAPAKRGFRVRAGVTYRIAVDGQQGKMGRFNLALRHTPRPANDMLANAEELRGDVAQAAGTNFGASSEIGEPGPADGASVWYSWTAPHTGLARVELPVKDFEAELTVYTGDRPAALVRTGRSDTWGRRQQFRADAGRTYRIAVTGGQAALQGDFTLKLTSLAAPPNDEFANARSISGESGRAESTLSGATAEPDERVHGDREYQAYRASLWYRWTAPRSGLVAMNLTTQGRVGAFAYKGSSLGTLEEVGRGSFRAVAGETYLIAVAGDETVDNAAFALSWATIAPPPNDDFAAATRLSGSSVTQYDSTVAATMQNGEPASMRNAYGERGGATVWYSWTAPATGLAGFTVNNGTAAAFEGDEPGSLQLKAWTYYNTSDAYFRAEAGRTYRIRVEGSDRATFGAFTLRLNLTPPPANDNFADAAQYSGGAVNGTTTGATSETGEPPGDGGLRGSVWYTWRPDRTGTAVLKAGDYRHIIVYTGDSLATLRARAANSSYYGGTVRTRVVAGQTYRIAVVAAPTRYSSPFTLSTEILDGPPNDDFADAEPLVGAADTRIGSNVNATREPDEPAALPEYDYRYSQGDKSVWYRWTAPATGRVTVDLSGSSFDTSLIAFEGAAAGSLRLAGGDNDSGDGNTSRLTISVRAGQTYSLAVNGNNGASGSIALKLLLGTPPPNDEFAGATELTGSNQVASSTLYATAEPNEPEHYERPSATLWYAWTAPANGRLTLDLAGSEFGGGLAVYEGASLGALTRLAGDRWSRPRKLSFDVRRGKKYRIAVDGSNSQRGAVKLAVTHVAAPASDDVADAQPVIGRSATASGTLVASTWEGGEPMRHWSASGTVWYRWTAPGSGPVSISLRDRTFWPAMAVYSGGGGFGGMKMLNNGSTGVRFTAIQGETYTFSVVGQDGQGAFTFDLHLQEPPPNDHFANARALTGLADDAAGTTLYATREYCEQQHDADYFDPSVWYSWTATADGTATIDLVGTSFIPTSAVYTGASNCDVVRVTTQTQTPSAGTRREVFEARAGQTYRVAVDSADSRTGPFSLALRQAVPAQAQAVQAPPAHDPPPQEAPPSQTPPSEPVEEPPVSEPGEDDPPVEEPPAADPPSQTPPIEDDARAGDPPTEEPPVSPRAEEEPATPPANEPPPAAPPVDDPPVEHPPVEHPPVVEEPTTPPAGKAPAAPPAEDPPRADVPAQEPPAEDPPVSPRAEEEPATPPADPPTVDDPPAPPAPPAPADDPPQDPPVSPRAEENSAQPPPASNPPTQPPPATAPPADTPPAQDPPAEQPPRADTSPASPRAEEPVPQQPTGRQPQAEEPPQQAPPAPGQPPVTAPSPPAPLSLDATVAERKLATVLAKGLTATVACSRACALDVVATIDAPTARKLRLRGSKVLAGRTTLRAFGAAPVQVVLRFDRSLRSKLRTSKSLPITLRVVATDGSERAARTLRLKLKP